MSQQGIAFGNCYAIPPLKPTIRNLNYLPCYSSKPDIKYVTQTYKSYFTLVVYKELITATISLNSLFNY